jgi:hypothetical protein
MKPYWAKVKKTATSANTTGPTIPARAAFLDDTISSPIPVPYGYSATNRRPAHLVSKTIKLMAES